MDKAADRVAAAALAALGLTTHVSAIRNAGIRPPV